MPNDHTARSFVPYLRVSTDKQGRSGLGLEAQQAAINAFLQPGDRLRSPPFVEVESGKNADRPKLREALARCRATGATLLIAKLDRLARSVHFIAGLMKADVAFVACDMPTATPFVLHVYAAVGEEEARAISQRTKLALAAAKARGTRLGGDRGYRPPNPPDWTKGVPAASKARRRVADHTAHAALPAIEKARQDGAASLHQIAAVLNANRVATPGGGTIWTATGVRRVIMRTSVGIADDAPD
jgi:DNA invertase Pin-like site-specific DNA recombinase